MKRCVPLASCHVPSASWSPSTLIPKLPRETVAASCWSLHAWCRLLLHEVFLQQRDVTSANRADKFAAVLYLHNLILIDR